MAQDESSATGPDLTRGILLDELQDGQMFPGHIAGEQILLVREGMEIFAVGAHCTHYHASLGPGRPGRTAW